MGGVGRLGCRPGKHFRERVWNVRAAGETKCRYTGVLCGRSKGFGA